MVVECLDQTREMLRGRLVQQLTTWLLLHSYKRMLSCSRVSVPPPDLFYIPVP